MRFFIREENRNQSSVIPWSNPGGLVEELKSTIVEKLSKGDGKDYQLYLKGAAISDKDVVQEVLQDGDLIILKSENVNHSCFADICYFQE